MKNSIKMVLAKIKLLILFSLFTVPLFTQETVEPVSSNTSDSLSVTEIVVKTDSLFYSADSVLLNVKDNKIQLLDNASIKYKKSMISSNKIEIDLDNDKALSYGKTIMQDADQILIGNEVFVDFDKEKGLIIDGGSKFEKGYYYGNEIRKTDDKTFDIDYGRFTTCDSKNPHFHIQANKLRIYQDDKIVARPVYFIVIICQFLLFPMELLPLNEVEKTGILVPSPGYDNIRGKFIENIAFYLPYKIYAGCYPCFDYYEKTGWELSFDSSYKKRYYFNGDIDFRLQNRIEGPLVS